MTSDEFRKLALEIPSAAEMSHMHNPDFRLGGRIFATLGWPDEQWGMVKVTPEQQRAFMKKSPHVFYPCKGAWGRRGYTNFYLANATRITARTAIDVAAKNIALQKEPSSA
jgi:hypothetical protein